MTTQMVRTEFGNLTVGSINTHTGAVVIGADRRLGNHVRLFLKDVFKESGNVRDIVVERGRIIVKPAEPRTEWQHRKLSDFAHRVLRQIGDAAESKTPDYWQGLARRAGILASTEQ